MESYEKNKWESVYEKVWEARVIEFRGRQRDDWPAIKAKR